MNVLDFQKMKDEGCNISSAKYLSYAAPAIIPIALMKPMEIYFESTST